MERLQTGLGITGSLLFISVVLNARPDAPADERRPAASPGDTAVGAPDTPDDVDTENSLDADETEDTGDLEKRPIGDTDDETADESAPDGGLPEASPCDPGSRYVAGLCLSKCRPACAVDEICTRFGDCAPRHLRDIDRPKTDRAAPLTPNLPEYDRHPADIDAPAVAEARDRKDVKAWFGAHLSGGLSTALGSYWRAADMTERDGRKTPSFTFGGYFDLHFYLMPTLALVTGVGAIGKGITVVARQGDEVVRDTITYVSLPVGVKYLLGGFQLGAALGLNIGLVAVSRIKTDDDTIVKTWKKEDWAYYRRVNLAAKLFAGYIFEKGTVVFVPGVELSLHLINDISERKPEWSYMPTSRYLAVLVTLSIARAR